MRSVHTVLSIAVIACAPVLLPGCGASEKVDEPLTTMVSVEMTNTSAAIVHIFALSETFPCCQLPSGGSRTRNLVLSANTDVTMKVGQNGAILKEKVCTYSHEPKEEVTLVHVRWDGVSIICAADW